MAGKMGTAGATQLLAESGEQRRIGALLGLHLLQGSKQALSAHRLQQVIDSIEVESLHRVVVVGRRENDCRRLLQQAEMRGQFYAIHTRHADVGQHDICHRSLEQVERLPAVSGLADDLGRQLHGDVAEQRAQAFAGERLVVDQQDFQRRGRWHGSLMRTS